MTHYRPICTKPEDCQHKCESKSCLTQHLGLQTMTTRPAKLCWIECLWTSSPGRKKSLHQQLQAQLLPGLQMSHQQQLLRQPHLLTLLQAGVIWKSNCRLIWWRGWGPQHGCARLLRTRWVWTRFRAWLVRRWIRPRPYRPRSWQNIGESSLRQLLLVLPSSCRSYWLFL